MTPLPLEFRDLLKSLNSQGVEYMLVGGWAVIHYGYVRYTGDIDIWIAASSDNADRVILALTEFVGIAPKKQSIVKLRKTIEIGNSPLRVHLMCDISGVEFEDCIKNKIETKWDDIPVTLISLEDLLRNKRATGRLKDAVDVEFFDKALNKHKPAKRKKKN